MTADAAAAQADIVVGLVSCNNAAVSDVVAGAVRQTAATQWAGATTRFVLADCGSTDDTPARLRSALGGTADVVEVANGPTTTDLLERPYHRMPGKARAVHGILAAAQGLGARACVVLDAGVESVTPQGLERLCGPVVSQGFDLAVPYYRRHPYEGALIKGIVSPAFQALYGVRLRQPAAGEFACSAGVIDYLLDDDCWDRDGAQVGIDLWLAGSAVSDDFRIAEAALGPRRYAGHSEEPLDLGTTVTQVVGALFADLEHRVERWQRVRGSVAVQQFGDPAAGAPVRSVSIDQSELIETFRLGYRELRDIWTWVLPPRTIVDLRRLVDGTGGTFHLDDDMWARIIYDFALGYRLKVLPREHLLRSLVPLYLAWFASFVADVRDRDDDHVEERLARLAAVFEAQKPYLISKWRWPERLRS